MIHPATLRQATVQAEMGAPPDPGIGKDLTYGINLMGKYRQPLFNRRGFLLAKKHFNKRSIAMIVRFRSLEDRAKARRLVYVDKPVLNLPICCLVLDVWQLLLIKQANIPIYSPSTKEAISDSDKLNIDEIIDEIRRIQKQVDL